jgi:hypothetical protein
VKLNACFYNIKGGDVYDFHLLQLELALRQITYFFMLHAKNI